MSGVDIVSITRVGRYGVDVPGFESVALPALDHAEEGCAVMCIDEIGRMELLSAAFRRRVEELIQRPKPMIAVLHRGYVDQYGGLGRIYQVTPENRERLPQLLVFDIERGLG
jgi:nucleoside-triphosphatase